MLLYLARHAQTASSAVDSFNGRSELPLTDTGRDQARRLGVRLAGVRFAAVYRSPLRRTEATARLVAPAHDPQPMEGLTEIDYGQWEGLSPQQAEARDPDRYARWVRDPAHVAPPEGETAQDVASRALLALREMLSRHEGDPLPVLAVSHKATLRILAAALTGAPIAEYRRRWSQDECALNLIELRSGKDSFLRLWNDTSHLGPDPASTTRPGK